MKVSRSKITFRSEWDGNNTLFHEGSGEQRRSGINSFTTESCVDDTVDGSICSVGFIVHEMLGKKPCKVKITIEKIAHKKME